MMVRLVFLMATLWSYNPVLSGQTVTGSWYGRADVQIEGSASNYLTEFTLKQKGNEVEGIFGYYFKDSYQSFFVRGTYTPQNRQVHIPNLPMLFYASPTRTGIECPMHFVGTLMVSRVKSTLNGNFYTEAKYRYTCPELRVSLTMDNDENNADSLLQHSFAGRKYWMPAEEDILVTGGASDDKDTLPASFASMPIAKAPPISEAASKLLVHEFEKRKNTYEKDIVIYNDTVLVSFYDNGDIDDDTISVFLNKEPVLIRRGLTSRALNIYIGLDPDREINELSMFADNLGKYPPNTALMVISDGQRRFEVYLSASLKQNASVRLRRFRAD